MKQAVIITGASGSMGAAATRALSANGYSVIMACRNLEKADAVRRAILQEVPEADIHSLHLNLSKFSSVRKFTESVLQLAADRNLELTGLFNNAGVINSEYGLTEDGYERTLQTNFISPALLTLSMLPNLSEKSHIVNMVSLTCRFGHVSHDLFHIKAGKFSQLSTYADTKLALLLFTIELGRRIKDYTSRQIFLNVSDPGIVNSNMISMNRWFDPIADLLFRPFCKSPERGVLPALNALESDVHLHYFKGGSHYGIPARYTGNTLSQWLWEELEQRADIVLNFTL